MALLAKTMYDLPIGRKNWTLYEEYCGQDPGEDRLLLLTRCGSGSYSCDDGTCVPIHERCDLKVDCSDKSDERGCSVVKVQTDYRTDIPPPGALRGSVDPLPPLPITLHIVIDKIDVFTSSM
ncbi:unnamed protein product, partial [Meganyctiphanes norvegica]